MLKAVLELLQEDHSRASAAVNMVRLSFMTNIFMGVKTPSAFQLSGRYALSLLGIPRKMITQDLLDVYSEREKNRAMERIMRANAPRIVDHGKHRKDDEMLVYYTSSNLNEPNQWLEPTVELAEQTMLLCKRSSKGPHMSLTYEDVRLIPEGQLKPELIQIEANEDIEEDEITRSHNKVDIKNGETNGEDRTLPTSD